MSWSDAAILVSTVAACGAALFAYLTVRDTRRFHEQQERERQLDGLLAVTHTVSQIADIALRVINGAHDLTSLMTSQQARLKVELAALPEFDLPMCRAVTDPPSPSDVMNLEDLCASVLRRANKAMPELEGTVRSHVP